jgi:hypothetical protein
MFNSFASADNGTFNNKLFSGVTIDAMDDFDRLLRAAKKLHPKKIKNQTALATFLGVLPQHITNWKKRGLPKGEITAICRTIGCSPDWVELGIGEMSTQEAQNQDANTPRIPDAKERTIQEVVDLMRSTDYGGCQRIAGAVRQTLREYQPSSKANAQ